MRHATLFPSSLFPSSLFLSTALAFAAWAPAASAADTKPEITRPAIPAQAVGKAHTLRTIPEACTRLQGEFTGDAGAPYRFAVVRTSARCQPRARVVDAAKAGAPGAGWILNDRISVPSAACPAQQALVRVWRKDTAAPQPALDAQGKSRIYLEEGMRRARSGQLPGLPVYAVAMELVGKPCR
jgi:hypothetical protein